MISATDPVSVLALFKKLGLPARLATKNEWVSRKDTVGYDLVTLNHYVLRSAESFLVKRDRVSAAMINDVTKDLGILGMAS